MSKLFYRIATTQAGLEKGANFFVRGISEPDLVTFSDHSERKPQSTGGEARQGYTQVSILWNELTAVGARAIKELIESAEVTPGQGQGTLWLTIPRTDAPVTGVSWVDLSGTVIMPQWEPRQRARGLVYENVVLRLNNCTVAATPSTVQS